VLAYSFDRGTADDSSGNDPHGTVEGAQPVRGKVGQGLKFVAPEPVRVAGFTVVHHWTADYTIVDSTAGSLRLTLTKTRRRNQRGQLESISSATWKETF